MIVAVKRFDEELPLPEYKTSGAVAMDCYVRKDFELQPGEVALVPLNIALRPPKGHFVLMAARSSLHKRKLTLISGVGIGDEDFSGSEDEYHAPILNFGKEPVSIKRGERLVQMMVLPFDRVEWEEVKDLGPSRGGFGTTGH